MLTKNHAQESLSRAYMYALASAARVYLDFAGNFDYGIDGHFDLITVQSGPGKDGKIVNDYSKAGFQIDFQLKSSTRWRVDGDDIVWSISSMAYNKLVGRGTPAIPVILVLLCLPKQEEDWTGFTDERLLLQKCCYFASIRGSAIPYDSSKQLRIPRRDLLNPLRLKVMLEEHRDRLSDFAGAKD